MDVEAEDGDSPSSLSSLFSSSSSFSDSSSSSSLSLSSSSSSFAPLSISSSAAEKKEAREMDVEEENAASPSSSSSSSSASLAESLSLLSQVLSRADFSLFSAAGYAALKQEYNWLQEMNRGKAMPMISVALICRANMNRSMCGNKSSLNKERLEVRKRTIDYNIPPLLHPLHLKGVGHLHDLISVRTANHWLLLTTRNPWASGEIFSPGA